MNPQTGPSKTLLVAGVILVFLVGIAIVVTFVTARISRNLQVEETAITPKPSPTERSIYLDLPESFPKDMPLIKDGKVTVGKEEKDQWVAVFTTTMSVEQVERFYNAELPRNGWTIANTSQAAGLTILQSKKNSQDGIIVIGKGDRGVTVSITILKGS